MSDAATNEISSPEGRYRIGTAANLTGISTHALRVWERRYQTIQPRRILGGDGPFCHPRPGQISAAAKRPRSAPLLPSRQVSVRAPGASTLEISFTLRGRAAPFSILHLVAGLPVPLLPVGESSSGSAAKALSVADPDPALYPGTLSPV